MDKWMNEHGNCTKEVGYDEWVEWDFLINNDNLKVFHF